MPPSWSMQSTFSSVLVEAKQRSQAIDLSWYKQEMLSSDLSKEDIATHAGINIKTVQNMGRHNSQGSGNTGFGSPL